MMNQSQRIIESLGEATKVIAKFTNKRDGVRSEVAEVSKGFSVILRDLDSGEVVNTVLIFKDKAKAIRKAKEIVK